MRIGGPPRGPTGPRGPQGAKGVGKAQGTGFTTGVGKAGDATEDQSRRVRSAMMAEIERLAAELDRDEKTKEEVTRDFVKIVIREKFKQKKRGKGDQQMEDNIGDIVEADPQFVAKLHGQLKKLSSK